MRSANPNCQRLRDFTFDYYAKENFNDNKDDFTFMTIQGLEIHGLKLHVFELGPKQFEMNEFIMP